MAKTIVTVDEVLAEMTASENEKGNFNYNRFSKKNFNKLLKTVINDVNFKTTVAHVKKGELESVEEIEVSKDFRKFVKKILEKFGVDKSESEKILSEDFQIDNVDGLYEFIATVIYLYIERGNQFAFLDKEDFKGSIGIKKNKKSTKTVSSHSPQTGEFLGDFEITKDDHKTLVVKSTCPKYLKKRQKK